MAKFEVLTEKYKRIVEADEMYVSGENIFLTKENNESVSIIPVSSTLFVGKVDAIVNE